MIKLLAVNKAGKKIVAWAAITPFRFIYHENASPMIYIQKHKPVVIRNGERLNVERITITLPPKKRNIKSKP